ncbi:MAG: hypothetical protein LBC07_03085 [Elusimicrobiota bacterium]|nr:hypothetical protein [Elusimicrobiota bacterium]
MQGYFKCLKYLDIWGGKPHFDKAFEIFNTKIPWEKLLWNTILCSH